MFKLFPTPPRCTLIVLSAILLAGVAARTPAASLGVSPSGFILQELRPGTTHDIYKEAKVRLTINNGDDTSHTYLVKAYRPSQRGRWEKGYLEIPDPSWCRFDPPEVTVGPNRKGHVQLFVSIPEGEKYFNQRWVVTCGIEGKPGPNGIALAVDVRAQIETTSKAGVRERPDGPLGLAPSLIRFENLSPGGVRAGRAMLYNNEPTTRTYQVLRLLADPAIRPTSYLTLSYGALPERRWLALDRDKLTLGPGASAPLTFSLTVPAGPDFAEKRWEEILLVQPDKGLPGLVRIQIITNGQ